MTQLTVTESQLAERLGVSVRTLQNWRWQGIGPRYFKLSPGRGGRVRYRVTDIEAWENAKVAEQTGGDAA